MRDGRLVSLDRIRIPSPNHSGRGGAKVRLIVLHTAEGALTYTSLGAYFGNPSSEVSSHVGIDDTPNTVGEYVDRSLASWTAANANPVAIQAELCGFAAWTEAEWINNHHTMLTNMASWIAEEAAIFGIPLIELNAQQAQTDGIGICRHSTLGSWGGNHSDPGPGFPLTYVISLAQGNPPTEDNLISTYYANNQHHVYRENSNGTVDHWWMDLGSKPVKWNKETLPK